MSVVSKPPVRSLDDEISTYADTVWTRGSRGSVDFPKYRKRSFKGPHGKVVIVGGVRTPFAKSGTDLAEFDVIDLASIPSVELVTLLDIDPKEIDYSIFGVVIPALYAPNLGREVIFRNSFPNKIPGTTVNLACASSCKALTLAAEMILNGNADLVLVGGAESLTNVPLRLPAKATRIFTSFSKAKTFVSKVKALSGLSASDLVPIPPAIAEYTTGLTMGESAEKMVKENKISRKSQDELALLSHERAASAIKNGSFASQIVTVYPPPYERAVETDNGVRFDTSIEALSKLKPVFDKKFGTITAGNASPITDGGSALLVASEKKAKELGLEPLASIRSWAWWSVDPFCQLLQGPAYAAPLALDLAGVKFKDIDLIEMHEAFAAQVISNMKAFASKKFAKEELGRDEPLGVVELERWNVYGGSISIGHPFGATGARVVMQLANAMKDKDRSLGLATVCAAGGVGFAMVIER